MALKLNKDVLVPFLGRSVLAKKIGHVDFLVGALGAINEHWQVSRLYCIGIFDFVNIVATSRRFQFWLCSFVVGGLLCELAFFCSVLFPMFIAFEKML